MGRRKFRLSDMIPNAWFYKLRDMRAPSGRGPGAMHPHHQPPPSSSSSSRGNRAVQHPGTPRINWSSSSLPHRASYYYTTRDRELPLAAAAAPKPKDMDAQLFPLPESPPKNSRRRHRVGPVRLDHAPGGVGLGSAPPVSARGQEPVADLPGTSRGRRDTCIEYDGGEVRRHTATVPAGDGLHGTVIASEKDIIIDLRANDTPGRVLRPIVTRPARRHANLHEPDDRHVDFADVTTHASSASSEKGSTGKPRRSSATSSPSGRRLKTRANSPRLAAAARKGTRKSTRPAPAPALADSFAVVKSSSDPRRDFLESMEEMIAEKGIRGAADLEDLLACYLSLNAAEYHDLIIEVFEQIWTSLANVRP